MTLRARPVASLYKRADYKTEFDIFKQNTELDLISLVSIEDDPKEQDFINRRCYSSRPTVKHTGQTQASKIFANRCASARYLNSNGLNSTPKQKPFVRTCKSAVSRFNNANYGNRIKTSNFTTPRYRRGTSSDQSSLNKGTRINVDFRCDKYTNNVQTARSKSDTKPRQVKSAYAPRDCHTHTYWSNDSRYDSGNATQILTNRVNSASVGTRPTTSSSRKPCRIGYQHERVKDNIEIKDPLFNSAKGDKGITIDGLVTDGTEVSKCETREGSIDSVDSGVVKDQSVRLSIDTDPFETKSSKEDHQKDYPDDESDISCCSIDGSDLSAHQDGETSSEGSCFGLHAFINDLVDRDGVRSRLDNVECSIKDIRSETESLFSLYTDEEEQDGTNEQVKELVDDSNAKVIPEPQNIIMSKEAKSIIIETLHDLKETKQKGDKENFEDNIRYKSVRKQKRMKENRSKYDFFMRERTESYIQLTSRRRDDRERESDYEKKNDLYESEGEALPALDANKKSNFFPSIPNANKRGSQTCSSASASSKHVYSLEQVKKRKYKIPGIGNYNLVASPDYDFEITPPGFDCRYDGRPMLTKDELDPPPKCIQERSIQKCKKWLKNVNLSPLALNPVINKKS